MPVLNFTDSVFPILCEFLHTILSSVFKEDIKIDSGLITSYGTGKGVNKVFL